MEWEASAGSVRGLGPKVRIEKLDVRDFGEIARVADRLGGETIDVLIANAGINVSREVADRDHVAVSKTRRRHDAPRLPAAPAASRSHAQHKMCVRGGVHAACQAARTPTGRARRRSTPRGTPSRSTIRDHGAAQGTGRDRREAQHRSREMLSPAESVAGLRAVVAKLRPEDTGGFFHTTGERLPW